MTKKLSDPNLSFATSGNTGGSGGGGQGLGMFGGMDHQSILGGLPHPPLGAIYGQLVTLDQLPQAQQHQQQSRKQQQHAQQQAKKQQQQQQHQSITPPSAASCSAYANLDPSYSLKNSKTAAAAKQQQQQAEQQPMEGLEAMEVSGSSGSGGGSPVAPPASASTATTATATTTTAAAATTNNNTYSYPTFPLTGNETTTPQPVSFRQPVVCGNPNRLIIRMSVKLIQTYETINEVSGNQLCGDYRFFSAVS